MGYSYSQPSPSETFGGCSEDTEEREIEALIHMDQENIDQELMAQQNMLTSNDAHQYPPQPEVEHGFPKVCYCGAPPILANSYNRRYFTCANVDDGEMHIHKWWDVAVMEEMRDSDRRYEVMAQKVDYLTLLNDYESDINQVRDMSSAIEQKVVQLETVVCELGSKGNRYRNVTDLLIVGVIMVIVVGLLVRMIM